MGCADAALAAGARPVLVPNDVTLAAEVTSAPEVALTLGDAVSILLEDDRGVA